VFRVQRNFLLASTGQTDPDVPLTGTGPEQAAKIREVKEMGNERLVRNSIIAALLRSRFFFRI
jgi:hypothetical protein